MRRLLEPEVSNSAYRRFMGVNLERKNPLNLFPRLSNYSFNLITSSYSMLASPVFWLKIYHTTLISYMWPEVFSVSILFVCCICLVPPRLEKLRYCDWAALTQNLEKRKERLLLFALKDSSQRPLIHDRTVSFWTNKNHEISGGFFLFCFVLFCFVLLLFFPEAASSHRRMLLHSKCSWCDSPPGRNSVFWPTSEVFCSVPSCLAVLIVCGAPACAVLVSCVCGDARVCVCVCARECDRLLALRVLGYFLVFVGFFFCSQIIKNCFPPIM